MAEVGRGDIFWAWLDDETVGNEQVGRRPVMIVNGPLLSLQTFDLVWAIPLTTRNRHWRSQPEVGCEGLSRPTYAMTEQLRSISTRRLKKQIGIADEATVDRVGRIVQNFLEY